MIMFCPVCGKEPQKEMEYMGAKVCSECGCVIELLPAGAVDIGKKKRSLVRLFAVLASVFCVVNYIIELNFYSDTRLFDSITAFTLLLVSVLMFLPKNLEEPKMLIYIFAIIFFVLAVSNLLIRINVKSPNSSILSVIINAILPSVFYVLLGIFLLIKIKAVGIISVTFISLMQFFNVIRVGLNISNIRYGPDIFTIYRLINCVHLLFLSLAFYQLYLAKENKTEK